MRNLIVVDEPRKWPLSIPGTEIISMQAYLTSGHSKAHGREGVRVFNLCSSYKYQSGGYYVSLLAAARGHKPVPSIATIQDMKTQIIVRMASDELNDLIQSTLAPIEEENFTLSIYFGKAVEKRWDRLAAELFKMFHTPFVQAHFRKISSKWQLRKVGPIPGEDIPDNHQPFVIEFAAEFFSKRYNNDKFKLDDTRYDLAILVNPQEKMPPSDTKALAKFVRTAESMGFATEFITKSDYSRLSEFDALFIRETTSVNHHTYRFARRAAAEGLVVFDDPDSILKCTNKVYLAELLEKHKILTPKTLIIHKGNVKQVAQSLNFPCILKQPDSAFSQGVIKVQDIKAFYFEVERLFETSDLILAQEFVPTGFDWRVGIIDQQPLYVCKYYMARNHWQIIKRVASGKVNNGKIDAIAVEDAPPKLIETAMKAANLIGDGLYGVDLKEVNGQFFVIEVNDNPNIDSGLEDFILKDKLYQRILEVIEKRIRNKKEPAPRPLSIQRNKQSSLLTTRMKTDIEAIADGR